MKESSITRFGLGVATVAALVTMALAFAVQPTSAAHNGAVLDTEANGCELTISADVADPAGTHLVTNMVLVVDDGDTVHTEVILTDGSSADITVGPFPSNTTVYYRVFGGGERDYDLPLWNDYPLFDGVPTLADYITANGTDWVTSGEDDANPFTNWYDVLVEGCDPEGEILEPEVDELVFGETDLIATYEDWDGGVNDDGVNWAVRADASCSGAQNNRFGNVNGMNDPYNWDGASFDAVIDTSTVDPGRYCFIFNPTDDSGQPDVRETRLFWVGDFSLVPEEAYNPVGSDHTVTASIGVELDGVDIIFETSGVNVLTSTVETDSDGNAEFTYSSGTAGTDTILACVDLDESATCDEGEPSAEVTKYWYDAYVHGGGQILEPGDNPKKKKDWLKISFGGGLYDLGADGLIGNWTVQFHNVGGSAFDKTTFHATEITELNLFDGDSPTCDEAMNFTALGTYNKMPGWKIIVRAGDLALPSSQNPDTLRVELKNPANATVYDTSISGDFPNESFCVGTARTRIDNGNLTIDVAD